MGAGGGMVEKAADVLSSGLMMCSNLQAWEWASDSVKRS